jgi:glyoxylase-like metal-dependent hydrolase (beta-lactamase superfamily II)
VMGATHPNFFDANPKHPERQVVTMSPSSFRLGDFTCYTLRDGSRSIGSMTGGSARRFLFGDAPDAEVEDALRPHGGIGLDSQIPFNYLLAEKEGHATLIDTGCGDQAENEKNPDEPAGLLVRSLNEAGFVVEDIDTVVVSHGHWDHFGGAVTGGKPTFPKAEYLMSEKEIVHIGAKGDVWAKEYPRALGGRLRQTPDQEKVGEGVSVRVTPGHTPGIIITELSSQGETLLYTSDIIIHQAHVEHLDWIPSFETDKVAAAAGRRNLIEDAYARKLLLFVPHIPNVLGRIGKSRSGYEWVDKKRV